MNGQGESLMNKTKFITGSIGTKCLPSLLHISVFGMHQNLVFSLSVSLLDTLLFVHAGQHQTDVWGQKVIHLVALERIHMMLIEKDQSLAIGIMITCTINSAYCLCCIVKILSSLYPILIAIKLLNTVPALMIKDNMEKAL